MTANELNFHGPEPTWEKVNKLSAKELETKVSSAYNWYNYAHHEEDKVWMVKQYLIENKYKNDVVVSASGLRSVDISSPVAFLMRMMSRGFVLSGERKTWFEENLQNLLQNSKKGNVVVIKKKKTPEVKKLTVQDYISLSVTKHLVELEERLDNIIRDGANADNFKYYDWLTLNKVKPLIAKRIAEYYRPQLEEVKMAISGTDKELSYGYRLYNNKHAAALRGFFEMIITDGETWAQNMHGHRRPRKKRVVSIEKQIQKVTYQKEDSSLKVVSIDPSKIIGANELWLFNTKYRVMQYYVAIDRGGFKVKGTTLKNYNEKLSNTRKIRKPEEVVREIIDGGPKVILKMYEKLKVKPTKVNGRLNKFTLILRAIT